uniref:Major facilitator superfamily (MFS) profile domain-containing protein n=1 Tax=Timema tahoe TaxID=61484 RepID=A0A7R9FGL2_9NEOP|nr:unnamed protein product [Timema tahoe]
MQFIPGLGAAGSSIMGPLYVTEIVDDDIRGSLVSYTGLFASSGILFAYVVGYYASYTTFTAICLAMPVAFMASFFWMPETPAYLISQNNPDGARKALMWLRTGYVVAVDQEMTKLEEAYEKGKDNRLTMSSFIQNLRSRGTLKALLISIGLVVNNQFSGITAVLSYTVNMFEDASSDISANVSTMIIGALQMFGVYLSTILIDRAGRKILLIVSNLASAVCLAALWGFFYLKANGHDVTHLGWLPVTSLGLYAVPIALGVNSIPFIVINEIFNPQMRGFGVALFMCLLNVMAFLVTRFFTDLNTLLGLDGCYWFFAVCLVTMAAFCYFIVPETKNRSLDSILKELAGEEIVEDDTRGSLGTFLVLFTNGGILFAYVLGTYLSYTTFSTICLGAPIVFMAAFYWMPESPVYLYNQKNPEAARKALMWLWGGDLIAVEQEMTKLAEATENMKEIHSTKSSFIKNLTSKGTLRGLLIGIGLMVNNQLSGIFAVLSYTVNIFQDAGSDISPNLCTIIIGVLQLFGVYLTSTLVDRAGRKILLIVSNVASAISLAALGGFFFLKGHGYNVAHLGWLPITNLSIYVVGIALGVGSNPFIVINEIFTPDIRGFAVTVCICLLNALAFLVTRFFTDLNTIIGVDGCYWFFAFCCLSSTFFCYFVDLVVRATPSYVHST